jgi:drug/metabolite transporter (DMT)-like permease
MLAAVKSSRRLAVVSLIITTAIWGSTFILVKDAVSHTSVMGFLGIRFLLAASLMLCLRPLCWRSLSRQGVGRGVLLGAALGAGYAAQTYGLRQASAATSGFITGMFVVFAPLISSVLLKRRVGTIAWLAVAVSTAGLALLGLRGWALGPGELLTLLCAFFFGLHIVGLGEWTKGQDAYALALIQIATVGVVSTAAALPEGLQLSWNLDLWLAIIVTSVLATGLAFVVQTWAQSVLPPTQAAVILTLEPAFAGVFAVILGGERLSFLMIAGGLCILGANWLTLIPRPPTQTGPNQATGTNGQVSQDPR